MTLESVEVAPDQEAFHKALNFAYKELLKANSSDGPRVLAWRREPRHKLWVTRDTETDQYVAAAGISAVDFDPLDEHKVPIVFHFVVTDSQKQRQGLGKQLMQTMVGSLPPDSGLTAFVPRALESFFHSCGFHTHSSTDIFALCRHP